MNSDVLKKIKRLTVFTMIRFIEKVLQEQEEVNSDSKTCDLIGTIVDEFIDKYGYIEVAISQGLPNDLKMILIHAYVTAALNIVSRDDNSIIEDFLDATFEDVIPKALAECKNIIRSFSENVRNSDTNA